MKLQRLYFGVLMLLLLTINPTCFGQDEEISEGKKEKVEQLKIAYLTKELNLTSSEAEKFWPVYNEMDAKLKELRIERRKLNQEIKEKYETLKEEEFKNKLKALLENEAKENAVKKEYADKIAAAITYKKTIKLITLEQEFKRELLKRLKEESQQNQGQHKKPGHH